MRDLHESGMRLVVPAPFETLMNDFRFAEYHRFGSESRMFEEVPDEKAPAGDGTKPPAKPKWGGQVLNYVIA